MQASDAIQRLSHSRELLLKVIAPLSTTELTEIAAEGSWTVKDLVGHIAAWEKALVQPLKGFLQGGEFVPEDIPDHDLWNSRQVEARRELTFDHILQEARLTRQELLELTSRLSPEQWALILPAPWGSHETLAQMLDGLAWHEEEHIRSIVNRFHTQ